MRRLSGEQAEMLKQSRAAAAGLRRCATAVAERRSCAKLQGCAVNVTAST